MFSVRKWLNKVANFRMEYPIELLKKLTVIYPKIFVTQLIPLIISGTLLMTWDISSKYQYNYKLRKMDTKINDF